MHITKYELSSFILGKTLGKGTFGKVKLATHKVTGQSVAIKILQKAKIKDVTDVERVSRQLHILKITQHSSIAQMYEIIETEQNIFIVMQFAPLGEFFDYIMDGKIKSQAEAHHYFVQIVAGLEYMHKLKISHRDIKPENMLLDNHNRLKIVDFGLSNMYKEGQLLLTACGSPCYASPEMIKGQQYDPQLTDVWSLGVVLFSMAFAKLPFEDDNTSVLYGKIKSGLYVIDKKISPELRDLLSKLLCVKPKQRYNIQAIKQHPWYKRQKMCKCYGIVVGFENSLLDQRILQQMSTLGYNVDKARRYLQNNIRNQVTTAYYLLMKKKFKKGDPSPYDINNQNFNKKSILPKMSKVNNIAIAKTRHQSVDFSHETRNKQTLEVQQHIFAPKQLKRFEGKLNKQRNCFSQMKSDQYDNYKSKISNLSVYRQGQHPIFKKTFRFQSKNPSRNVRERQSLSRSKKSQNSQNSLLDKRKSLTKNLQKQHNISINVYINNTKIQTPTRKKNKVSNSKLEKQLIQVKNPNNFMNNLRFSNKRLKTQVIDRSDMMQIKASKRYQNISALEKQSRSLQKSTEAELMQGSFWKKRSANNTQARKQYTTQSKKDRQSKLRKW